MSSVLPSGATAAEFTLRRFGRPVRLIRRNVSVTSSTTELMRNNPRRLFWMVQNLGDATLYIDFDRSVSSTTSIIVGGNGGYASLDVLEDGEAVGWEVYGVSPAATVTATITEIEAR